MEWKSIKDSLEEEGTSNFLKLFGRVKNIRKHKDRAFVDLVDHSGQIQLVIEKSNPLLYESATSLRKGTFVCASGSSREYQRRNLEVIVNDLEIFAENNLNVESPWSFNGSDPAHADKIFSFPEVYVSNPQRSAILKIKADFINALHSYFQENGFTLVEPPIITDKTLYGEDTAVEARVHGEKVFLSQCATFELEPLALTFGKVYTISPAFRNEPSGSKRHLAEYTHAKAEVLLADINALKKLSGNLVYSAMKRVLELNERELSLLHVDLDIDGLKPENHEQITYNEALNITRRRGSTTEFGEGLRRQDEVILTKYFGEKYVWVNFPPFSSEGFPYRRLPEDRRLSMTCDLIAPHGSGEMIGVAEKTTNSEELIQNLIEKGQKRNIKRYWNYIALREGGMPPHGGMGAAPERIIYGLLNLDHIRLTKPWPRYPSRKIIASESSSINDLGSDNLRQLIQRYNLR